MTAFLSSTDLHLLVFDDGSLKENPTEARDEVESLMRLMAEPHHPIYATDKHPLRHVFQSVWLRIRRVSFNPLNSDPIGRAR